MSTTPDAKGILVTACQHCGRTHHSVWPRIRIASTTDGPLASFPCPRSQRRLTVTLRLNTAGVAIRQGARPISTQWSDADDRAAAEAAAA